LFDKNLRNFKGDTSVNNGIKSTLSLNPDDFWYFNNGVTVLCHAIEKAAAYSAERKVGKFTFKDISVINGAQTIASLGEAFKSYPNKVGKANVLIRFINVEHAPEGYDSLITRYNNTQNKIENRDFAALDPQQQRLKNEFALDDIQYVFKTGDKRNLEIDSCDIEEVTVALACSNENVNLATDVNREIGKFWRDIQKPPYTILFNEKTTVKTIWNLLSIIRCIDDELKIYQSSNDTRRIMTAVHGNNFIYHFVIKMIGKGIWVRKNYIIDKSSIKSITSQVFSGIVDILKENYPKDFLYTLFKNHKKCQSLSYRMDLKLGLEQNLFSKLYE